MPRGRSRRPGTCPNCGAEGVAPHKTWQVVSPFPDEAGRITITIMGSYRCPNCGHSWRGVVSKIKAGGSGVEVEGAKRKVVSEREEPRYIEIDLKELEDEDL